MSKYNNYPIAKCAKELDRLMREHPTAVFYQKWTCEKCGDRVTGETPNKLFTEGKHDDCGHTTDLRKRGCNYMVHFRISGAG
jgi:hypothetical protein